MLTRPTSAGYRGACCLSDVADCGVAWPGGLCYMTSLNAQRLKCAIAQTKDRDKPKIVAYVVRFCKLRV
jgi:hypothetical protein